MVTQLQPDVRAYLHGGEVIKRYIRIEEVAHEYGFSVEETEYIAKAASSLYKLNQIRGIGDETKWITERRKQITRDLSDIQRVQRCTR